MRLIFFLIWSRDTWDNAFIAYDPIRHRLWAIHEIQRNRLAKTSLACSFV